MSTTAHVAEPPSSAGFRPEMVGTAVTALVAINAIVLGLFILIWPAATLLVAAVLFGIQLVIAGVARIASGIVSANIPGWERGLLIVVGLLILIAGVACLKNPGLSLAALVVLIGIGWLVDGVVQIALGATAPAGKRALPIILGAISVFASIVLLSSPVSALLTLLHLGGWILLIMGVLTLVVLVVSKLRGKPAVA